MSIREHRTEDLQYMTERITWIQEETERRAVLKEKATIINPAAPRTAPRIHHRVCSFGHVANKGDCVPANLTQITN